MQGREEILSNPFELLYNKLLDIEHRLNVIEKGVTNDKTLSEEQSILLSAEQARNYLNVASSTLYGLTSRKEIPFMKKGKRLYFKKEDLQRWVEDGNVEGSVPTKKLTSNQLYFVQPKRRRLG